MSDFDSIASANTAMRPLGFLPTWWDGESLYGLCSRLHALRGDKNRELGRMLFGREHACRVIDIPSGLGRFMHVTEGKLGTPEEIIRGRTVAAAYWPFASDTTRHLLIQAATDALGVPIPMVLGLPAGRAGAFHPLRSCAECRREATTGNGYATWQLADQMPGVWWCPIHGRPLEQVNAVKAIWRKPGSDGVELGPPESAEEEHALHMMRALSSAIASSDRISSFGLASAVVGRLKNLAIAASAARLNVERLNKWLDNAPHVRWMKRQGASVVAPANNWAVPMIRGRSRSHPLKWMILWTSAWRSEDVGQAVEAFKFAAQGKAVQEQGAQFLLWPEDLGRATDSGVPAEVEDAFMSCQTIQGVAAMLGSSTNTVRQWLSDYPRFGRAWLERVRERRIQQARENLIRVMSANPEISRSELMRTCNTDFDWLSRHAPLTMRSMLNRLPARKGPQDELF
jgi:hypothetical protein